MEISNELSDAAVSRELGDRLRRLRLRRNLDQHQLADEAGIGRATLQRLEEGEPANMVTLLRILRALGLLEGLNQLVPEPVPSPIEELERQGRQRQRAGTPRRRRKIGEDSNEPWSWGDEGGREA